MCLVGPRYFTREIRFNKDNIRATIGNVRHDGRRIFVRDNREPSRLFIPNYETNVVALLT